MSVQEKSQRVFDEIKKVVSGQDAVVAQALIGILANGNILLEGVPGVAKTLLVRSLAKAINLPYGRIQFTPDLMPSDVLGTRIYNQRTGDFELRKGPIFAGILLADEINRTPPKTQAALLEAMEERRVTIDGEALILPPPFIVFATQNPIDFEGTYPLPEAQQDRFLMKVLVDYPGDAAEINVLRRHHEGFKPQNLEQAGIQTVLEPEEILSLQAEVIKTQVEDKIFDYIYRLVKATRNSNEIQVGASPRAGIALLNSSKAQAQMRGREFVIPDDVRDLALPVLRHRILLRPEAEVEGLTIDQVLSQLIGAETVPR